MYAVPAASTATFGLSPSPMVIGVAALAVPGNAARASTANSNVQRKSRPSQVGPLGCNPSARERAAERSRADELDDGGDVFVHPAVAGEELDVLAHQRVGRACGRARLVDPPQVQRLAERDQVN